MKQKFHKGDHVYTAHHDWYQATGKGVVETIHPKEVEAIILGSYSDLYGEVEMDGIDYSVFVKGGAEESWFPQNKTRLIEAGRLDLLAAWERERDELKKVRGDIDWIFAHGADVLKSAHGATLATLGACVGVDDLWGAHGEGMSYYENAHHILHVAKPFLETGDKAGWLEWSKANKLRTVDYAIR